VTTTLEDRQGDVVVRIDGVPAVRCRSCDEGGEPSVTLGFAKAAQAAYDLVFAAASESQHILAEQAGVDVSA
jgi:hypothetical protein